MQRGSERNRLFITLRGSQGRHKGRNRFDRNNYWTGRFNSVKFKFVDNFLFLFSFPKHYK